VVAAQVPVTTPDAMFIAIAHESEGMANLPPEPSRTPSSRTGTRDSVIDNNWVENRIPPIATGRKNWLFAGSLRAGKRAAAIMSLIHSARLNGHDPFAYLRDVLERLPTQLASRIGELLPHRWQAA
jgi:hypothetical protein